MEIKEVLLRKIIENYLTAKRHEEKAHDELRRMYECKAYALLELCDELGYKDVLDEVRTAKNILRLWSYKI